MNIDLTETAETPAWLADWAQATDAGDRALEDLPGKLGPADVIALAAAHYQRAQAVALAEIVRQVEIVAAEIADVGTYVNDVAEALTPFETRRAYLWRRLRGRN